MDTGLINLIVVLTFVLILQGLEPTVDPKDNYLGRILKYLSDLWKLGLLKSKENQINIFLEDPDGGDARRPEFRRELKEIQNQIEFLKSNLDDIPFRWAVLILTSLTWMILSVVLGKEISDKIQDPWLSLVFALVVFLISMFALMVMGPLFAGTLSIRMEIKKKEKQAADLHNKIMEIEANMEDYGESEAANLIVGKHLYSRNILLGEIQALREELTKKSEKFGKI